MSDERLKSLTPIEEQRAREAAFLAFQRDMELRMPKADPVSADYVHENPRVIQALKWIISVLPAILGIIAISAIAISADKTFTGFRVGVTNKLPAVTFALGFCGVIMTELGLIYVEFAIVRERLKKGLQRQVFNLREIGRVLRVLRGLEAPRDYSEMPDSSLMAYSRLIFGIVLAANLYGAYKATEANADPVSVGFALALGVAGAFSLRFIGAQLAHITYEIMEQERKTHKAQLDSEWRAEMDRRWAVFEADAESRALHRAFIVKNGLALDANTPYLLQAGEDGEPELAPFEQTTLPISSQRG